VAFGSLRTYILNLCGTPHFIHPCKPIAVKIPPIGDCWLYEPKLDGYRLQIVKDGREMRLYSKGGQDWTKRLPRLDSPAREPHHLCSRLQDQ
jgi:ATP-dependent DNA ligase